MLHSYLLGRHGMTVQLASPTSFFVLSQTTLNHSITDHGTGSDRQNFSAGLEQVICGVLSILHIQGTHRPL